MARTIEKLIEQQKNEPNSKLYSRSIESAKLKRQASLTKPKLKGREFVLTCGAISGSFNALIRKYIELGPSVELMQAAVSGFLAKYVSLQTEMHNDPKFIWALEDEDLLNQWLLAVYFGHADSEILYRNKIKEFLVNPPEDSQWEDKDDYDPIHFAFVENMLASVEAGQLTSSKNESAYDSFFSDESIPVDPLQKLTDIHIKRASKGKGLKDPLEYNPWSVFPVEIMAWYRVAQNFGVNIEVGSSYASQFIEIPFELKITHPDYLELLKDVSDLIGFNVIEKYLC